MTCLSVVVGCFVHPPLDVDIDMLSDAELARIKLAVDSELKSYLFFVSQAFPTCVYMLVSCHVHNN